jgi:2-aminoethylphosphonate-pyruvate transaminase
VQTLLPPEEYSCVLSAYRLPDGRRYADIHDALKSRGFVIYAGQGALAASIFRIAHMGDISQEELAELTNLLRQIF